MMERMEKERGRKPLYWKRMSA